MKHVLKISIVAAVLLATVVQGQMKIPRKSGTDVVYDLAGVLDAEAKDSIDKVIRPLLPVKKPIVVLTIKTLEDYGAQKDQIDRFARLVFNDWGIGDRSTGSGALIVVATVDRKMWIEVGKALTDPAKTEIRNQIMTDVMTPNFKAGDWAGGLREGVIAIRDRLYQPGSSEDLQNLPVEADSSRTAEPVPDDDLGLPGPPPTGVPGGTGGGRSLPPPEEPGRPRSGPGGGADVHKTGGSWLCFAIGILILISIFRRRRRYGYGYGPTYGPPPMGTPGYGPPGYGYRRRGGGGLGGMVGGMLTGLILGRMGRGHGGGSSGGSVFGGGGDGGGGGSVFGGGGGGGGGPSPFGGGSSGGGSGASW